MEKELIIILMERLNIMVIRLMVNLLEIKNSYY